MPKIRQNKHYVFEGNLIVFSNVCSHFVAHVDHGGVINLARHEHYR